jgi:hypothetical protein
MGADEGNAVPALIICGRVILTHVQAGQLKACDDGRWLCQPSPRVDCGAIDARGGVWVSTAAWSTSQRGEGY